MKKSLTIKKGEIWGIIPARGGSKRIPNKNIVDLHGKPLINWTIDEAYEANCFDRIILSTDSNQIVSCASKFAEVPFLREQELSLDESKTTDVIIDLFDRMGQAPEFFMLLQPTSPLRTKEDIRGAIQLVKEEKLSVVSVTECEHSPLWSNTLGLDRSMKDFLPKEYNGKRSQDLKKYFRLNGAIYLIQTELFILKKSFFIDETFAYVMPNERSVDIDRKIDLDYAEFLLSKLNDSRC